MSDFNWDEAAVARLRQMYDEGKSSGLIAKEFRISRNAVIGKLNRIGLFRGKFPAKTAKMGRPRERKPNKDRVSYNPNKRMPTPLPPKPRPPEPPPAPDMKLVRLLELKAHECKWPVGDGPFLFCAAPAKTNVYCPYHSAISAWRPTR